MKFFTKMKDGGPDSRVHGYFLFEIKGFASIAVLNFLDGTREAFHNHAFSAVSWLLKGELHETYRTDRDGRWDTEHVYRPSIVPIKTPKNRMHRVRSVGSSWVLTFRGPWSKYWNEIDEDGDVLVLSNGRKVEGTL